MKVSAEVDMEASASCLHRGLSFIYAFPDRRWCASSKQQPRSLCRLWHAPRAALWILFCWNSLSNFVIWLLFVALMLDGGSRAGVALMALGWLFVTQHLEHTSLSHTHLIITHHLLTHAHTHTSLSHNFVARIFVTRHFVTHSHTPSFAHIGIKGPDNPTCQLLPISIS